MDTSLMVDDDALYADWKAFLQADRADLRVAATEAVLHIRELQGMEKCVQKGLVPLLAKNASYTVDERVSVNALQALVHLSSHGVSANQCIQDLMGLEGGGGTTTTAGGGGLNRMLEIVLSKREGSHWKQRVNLAMSLITNMTRTEQGAVDLVGRSLPEAAVKALATTEKLPTKPTLELLLAKFMNPAYLNDNTDVDYYDLLEDEALDSHDGDPYQHFAAILMNATQTEAGRAFVLKMHHNIEDGNNNKDDQGPNTVLQTVLSQLKSPNPIRRRGIAGTIRNCCLDRDSAWWLLNVVKLNKHILYPLAGPEELDVDEKQGLDPDLWLEGPDKKREPDHLTRMFLVESVLLLLSTGRASREKMRLDRTYVILKVADMVEEHEDVSELIYDCVNYLRRDEHGTAEGSSDQLVEKTYQALTKPSTTVARRLGASNASDDFDDVD